MYDNSTLLAYTFAKIIQADVNDVYNRLKRSIVLLQSSALNLPSEKAVAKYDQITMLDDALQEDLPVEFPLRISGLNTIFGNEFGLGGQSGDFLSKNGSSLGSGAKRWLIQKIVIRLTVSI